MKKLDRGDGTLTFCHCMDRCVVCRPWGVLLQLLQKSRLPRAPGPALLSKNTINHLSGSVPCQELHYYPSFAIIAFALPKALLLTPVNLTKLSKAKQPIQHYLIN